MIPQPSSDSNLLKEHQFYSSDDSQTNQDSQQTQSIESTNIEENLLIKFLNLIKQIIKFDLTNPISIDNLIRLFIIISIIFLFFNFLNGFLKRRRRNKLIQNSNSSSSLNNLHGLKEKKNIMNLV